MDLNKVYVIDIETNTLLANMLSYKEFPYKLRDDARLWCIVIRRVGDNTVFKAVKEECTKEWLQEVLSDCEMLVAHNGIKFDFIALKLFGILDYNIGYLEESDTLFGKPCRLIDTLLLSRLLNPDRYLGHSLDSWGERLKEPKMDYRKALVDAGLLELKSEKGAEFSFYNDIMLDYCIQDTNVNAKIFVNLVTEMGGYVGWKKAFKLETKLADLAIRRESLGFSFDKELAIKCIEDLTQKINDIKSRVNPILPPRTMLTQAEKSLYILPKVQIKADGSPSTNLLKKVDALGGFLSMEPNGDWSLIYGEDKYTLPYNEPLKVSLPGKIEDLNHVKSYLIDLGWEPIEWRERDLTRDTKKQKLDYKKQQETLMRYAKETVVKGLYKKQRLELLGFTANELYDGLEFQLGGNKPVRVPTTPMVRVGVEKELCPNLVKLGDKVAFAKDFVDYLTYRHRLSSIAGGDIEDMDFDEESPNTGYLSVYREEDGRVPTPAIEVGSSTNRYRHASISNVPRISSLYGKEMRSLFGSGPGFLQFGYDFSSLELRVQAGYIRDYEKGIEIGESLMAEKPNDSHTKNSEKLGISRSDAKSFGYACLPMETLVLTPEGWKDYYQLKEGDAILSYNQQRDVVEEDVILKKHFFSDKEVIKVANKHQHILCTEEHRWFGWKRAFENKKRIKKNLVFKTSEINQEYNILTSAPYVGGKSTVTPDEAFLLGLILSDGSISWSKRTERTSASSGKNKGVVLSIFQSPKYFLKEILDVCERLGLKTSVYNRKNTDVKQIAIAPVDARRYLDSVVGQRVDKHDINWCAWVMTLSYESLKSFVEGFFLGDGGVSSSRKNSNIFTISQNIGNIFDGIYLACLLIGDGTVTVNKKSGKGTCKVIRKKPRRYITCQEITKENLGVQDTFCLTTKNSSFIIKQEKYTGITGNCLYGAAPQKLAKMLSVSSEEGKRLYDAYWEAMLPLKLLKQDLELEWEQNGKEYIVGIDGRRIRTRSRHSLLNALFQSAGVICAKYTAVFLMERLEQLGYMTDPFLGKPDICSMIEYHDEQQILSNPKLFQFKMFDSEEEAKQFVSEWDGPQLSAISHGKKFFVTLPNVLSEAVTFATKRVEKELNLKFELGVEWIVGRNWAECH